MFYNVENLFDTIDDTLKDDDEFLPDGLRRWNNKRYRNKLNSIYKTITAAGGWTPPYIVGLCEVENRKVVEDLLNLTFLVKSDYSIIHEDSPDERGIDVCVIFRKDAVKILNYRYFVPDTNRLGAFRSRSILYVRCAIMNDTLHLIVNHWPSRRGGVLAGEELRYGVADKVRYIADSIAINNFDARIIIMGDFNCTPTDPVMAQLIGGNPEIQSTQAGATLYNLSGALAVKKNEGTYNYQGTWELIDQVIVSENLMGRGRGLSIDKQGLRIFRPEFLLRRDEKFPGMTTYPTYFGYRYQGGFSDHLPVILDLNYH